MECQPLGEDFILSLPPDKGMNEAVKRIAADILAKAKQPPAYREESPDPDRCDRCGTQTVVHRKADANQDRTLLCTKCLSEMGLY